MALLGLSCIRPRAIHSKQQEHEARNPRSAEKQTFCYIMQLLILQSVIRRLRFFLSACVIGCRCQAGKCEMVAEKLADGIFKPSKSCTSAERRQYCCDNSLNLWSQGSLDSLQLGELIVKALPSEAFGTLCWHGSVTNFWKGQN